VHDIKEAIQEFYETGVSGGDSFSDVLRQLESAHLSEVSHLKGLLKSYEVSNSFSPDDIDTPIDPLLHPESVVISKDTVVDLDSAFQAKVPVHQSEGASSMHSSVMNGHMQKSMSIHTSEGPKSIASASIHFDAKPISAAGSGDIAIKVTIATLIVAEGLPDMQSPYCVCTIRSKPDSGFRTNEHHRRTRNPSWHHEEVLEEFDAGDVLSFRLFEKDGVEVLGEADVYCSQFLASGFHGEIELEGKGHKSFLQIKISVAPKGDHIAVLPICRKVVKVPKDRSMKRGRSLFAESNAIIAVSSDKQREFSLTRACRRATHVIPPDAPGHMMWDLLGILVLMVDLIWIPMQVFDPANSSCRDDGVGHSHILDK
jgi:hypothetical protein